MERLRSPEPQPLGAIYDTNSKGRFDLVVYSDGVLCLRGTYVGVALRAAGIGTVGGGGGLRRGPRGRWRLCRVWRRPEL
jgi:hypothetical protein